MSKLNEYYNIANGLDALLEEYGKELTESGSDKGINGYLVHNVPDYADKYNYIVARYANDYDSLWFWGAWKDEKPAREAAEDIGGIVIYRNGYEKDHQPEKPETEETDECLKEAEEKEKEYKITCTFKDESFVNEVQLSGKNPEEVKKAFIEYLTDPDNFDGDEESTLKPEDIKNLKIEEITTESLKEYYDPEEDAIPECKFTPEEQEEYEIDEDGIDKSGDQWIRCEWCEDIVPLDDCRRELSLGWICDRCQSSLSSRGEKAAYYEAKDIKKFTKAEKALTEDTNLINAKVADVEYNDDDGYDRHVLIYLGNEDKTEEEIEDDLTEQGMIYVFVNDIFEKEIPAKNYSLYDVIESYDVPDGEGVSYTIGGEDDDEWEEEDELTEYLVKGLQEHINDRPEPIEDNTKAKGQDNAVVDCPVHKIIAHSEDEKPLDCKIEKPALKKPLAGDEVKIK